MLPKFYDDKLKPYCCETTLQERGGGKKNGEKKKMDRKVENKLVNVKK